MKVADKMYFYINWIIALQVFMPSDLWEAGLVAVFDHTDEVGGSGCNKLWPERPHD